MARLERSFTVRVTGMKLMRRLMTAARDIERLHLRYQMAASPDSRQAAREAIVAAVPRLVRALHGEEET